MLKDLNIPRMGSVENAKLVSWHVQEGGAYAVGDILFEIETDKTTTEVVAEESGILAKHLAAEGDEFKVGDRVGQWAPAGTSASALRKLLAGDAAPTLEPRQTLAAETKVTGPEVAAAPRPLPRSSAGGQLISPLARRLAALHGINPAALQGGGPRGRITSHDILMAAMSGGGAPPSPPKEPQVLMSSNSSQPLPPAIEGESLFVPHSMRRRTIANRMTMAASIPSLTADVEMDLTALLAKRKSMPGVSVLGFIAHEAVAALAAHRRLNAHWQDDGVVEWSTVHLGVAVDAPEGLVVPVIRHAERLGPVGLTHAIADLAAKARDGGLKLEEMEGGTFTISNPGSVGPVIRAEALLNPPQVALLGLPGIVRAPVAIPDGDSWSIAVRPLLRASLTFDHRALDGGPVIAFLNTLKARIEAL
jgi:pyruvate/2-oxoglutarate dehydrogenase complex dihydrolipoamide acyltransferase (E2) component